MARVLLVDDDEAVRTALRRVLEKGGHLVEEVSDGQTALRSFAGNPPDLVVSDVYMPAMGGIEFLMRLRETFPEAKVILISGGGHLEAARVLEASSALGAAGVLPKPIDSRDLLRTVEEALGPASTSGERGDQPRE